MELLPFILGGGGLVGLGGLIATLYLLRVNRDDTIARAARTLVEGSTGYTEGLRADLDSARREIRELAEKVEALTVELRAAREDADHARAERDEAVERAAASAARLGGRRKVDEAREAGA